MRVIYYILLSIILIFGIILIFPIHLILIYKEKFAVYIKIFGIKIQIFGKSKKSKKLEAKPVFKNNQDFDFLKNLKNVFKYLNTTKKFLKEILKHTKIKTFVFQLKIAGQDAYETAVNYGQVSSLIYPIFQLIYNTKKPKNYDVVVSPNFSEEKNYLNMKTDLKINIYYLIYSFLYLQKN